MSRYRLWGSIALTPVICALLVLAGCSGDKKADRAGGGGKADEGDSVKPAAKKEWTPIKSTQTGTLKGKVTFAGAEIPKPRDLKPEMEKRQEDKDHCLKGETVSQEWVVNPANKGVQFAIVFLKAPEGKCFDVPQNLRSRTDTVTVDQPFCAFEPHATAVNTTTWDPATKKQVKTGQALHVQNSAPITHNTAWHGNTLLNPGKNEILPPKKDTVQSRDLPVIPCKATETGKEDLVSINCDIHKWMTGSVAVFDHPYYAVTDKDGNYEIKNVPADAEVEVVLWHDSMKAPLNQGKKDKMTLKAGDNTKDFTIGQ